MPKLSNSSNLSSALTFAPTIPTPVQATLGSTASCATTKRMQETEYQATERLIALFNATFYADFATRLVRGGDEPIYLPANITGQEHQIVFARGFFASALHEIAHWCRAGSQRRQLEDYGYWYIPDGRTEAQQQAFAQVEVYPQAYEQCFTLAAGRKFNLSVDNLNGQPGQSAAFELEVHQLTLQLLSNSCLAASNPPSGLADQPRLQGRAYTFFTAVCAEWNNPWQHWLEQAQQELIQRSNFLRQQLL